MWLCLPSLLPCLRNEALRPGRQWELVVQAASFLCGAQGDETGTSTSGSPPERGFPLLPQDALVLHPEKPGRLVSHWASDHTALQKPPPSPPRAVHGCLCQQLPRPAATVNSFHESRCISSQGQQRHTLGGLNSWRHTVLQARSQVGVSAGLAPSESCEDNRVQASPRASRGLRRSLACKWPASACVFPPSPCHHPHSCCAHPDHLLSAGL